jgi:hypothetical protein
MFLEDSFVASRNVPINREMLYFNCAEVYINVGMGRQEGMEPQGFHVTFNVACT